MQLSIVVPCYNEGKSINDFYNMVTDFLKEEKLKYELIMVDDGSKDDTFKLLSELSKKDKNVKVIGFSRNFGKESAMLAGLEAAEGEYVSIMDADMQHTIEDLFSMYNKLLDNKEFDSVCSYRENRSDESALKRTLTSLFYRINNRITYIKLLPGASDFRVFKKSVRDAILALPEKHRFLKGIFSWIGFNTLYVPYTPKQRLHGKSNWSFFKLLKYSVNGMISFSTKPLKYVIVLSLFLFLVGILNFFLLGNLSHRTIILFISILLLDLSVISLYLIRIYNNSLQRPAYIIKSKLGFKDKTTK